MANFNVRKPMKVYVAPDGGHIELHGENAVGKPDADVIHSPPFSSDKMTDTEILVGFIFTLARQIDNLEYEIGQLKKALDDHGLIRRN